MGAYPASPDLPEVVGCSDKMARDESSSSSSDEAL